MAGSSSSSVQKARKDLANRLAEIRRDAGLTGRDLAAAMGCYPSKVSRLQNATTPPSAADIRAWCGACGAADQATDLIQSLRAVEGMFVEWRRMERAGLRRAQEERLPLYERTRRFRAYSSWLVPGLMQTRAYTTATLREIQRRRGLPDDVDEAVEARMERQRLLYEPERTFAFVVEESVLRSGPGDAEVMVGQLGRLITVSSLPNVSVGVVPTRPGRGRWAAEGFWIYDSAQVNVELVSGYLTITQPLEVAMYAETFEQFVNSAMYGANARAVMAEVLRGLG
ncbi:helix-turn-helix domain-containing protein [Streptomyces sp. NPDC017941]|uniref:helix-turn-helix domain-containing protein n=1 Tax=Streptomyces sp. NPDC017941 TaxID=3365018 RepID=UPI0037BC29FB